MRQAPTATGAPRQPVACRGMHHYAFSMHNNSALHRLAGDGAVVVSGLISATSAAQDTRVGSTRAAASASAATSAASPRVAEPAVRARAAVQADAFGIAELIAQYTADGSLLRRGVADVQAAIDSFVVVTSVDGAVLACAALLEYSPSLAEVGSVAVAASAQGCGLGSVVVRAIERLARLRGHRELFAISLADHFFGHLGYRSVALERFPEKIARYDALRESGVSPVPKRCFRKRLRAVHAFPRVSNNTGLVSVPTVYHAKPAR